VTQSASVDRGRAASDEQPATKRLLLLSGAFLALQVACTDYGSGSGSAAAIGWFAIGTVLLWLVYRRRSRVARGFIVVTSFVGAVIYGLAAIGDARAVLLTVLYLGQALPLLAGPVRQHVRATPAGV
jgi:hypothetical protein